MWKLLSMFVAFGGVVGLAGAQPVLACGGCGMSGGGSRGGGRAVASRKVQSGGQNFARVAPHQPAYASSTTSVAAQAKAGVSPAVQTVAARSKRQGGAAPASPLFTCPMHPQVQWTKPVECPICGMKLKLKTAKADATKRDTASGDHGEMDMDDMSGMSATPEEAMDGMEGMMMCPGCMMNMKSMPGMGGKASPPASQKPSGGTMRGMAGVGCGC